MTTSEHQALAERTGDYETRLARLWERNLGVRAQRGEDYFQKGGDSLRGTQLLAWIGQGFGVELSLLDLFESRTIEAQARLLLARLDAAQPAADRPSVEYGFFGPADGRLFAAFHRPRRDDGNAGVLLCYPMGQEYMRVHRTYVELAGALATSGRPVLRFDYYGCGDSAGDAAAGDLDRWKADIQLAAEDLRHRTGVQEVHLVGARIGANLVLAASGACQGIAGVVLWEPIVDGPEYLAAVQRAQHDLLATNAKLDGYDRRQPAGCFTELIGFPVTKTLHDQLTAIDLLATAPAAGSPPTLLLAHSEKPGLVAYAAYRNAAGASVDYSVAAESDGIWLKEDRQNKGLIPARAVQAIVTWLAGRIA